VLASFLQRSSFAAAFRAPTYSVCSPAALREFLRARRYSSLTPHSTNLASQIPIDLSLITRHSSLLHLPASADSAKVNVMASLIQEVGETFFTLYKGFSVTLRTMFRKTTTESFPDAPPTVQPRYRGIHVLQRDEHGYEKCVGCFLCAAACPANCIYIEAAENTAANRISAGERYAKVYNIDYSRCIFCGYCVEACPTDAITHGHSIELAPYNINALIYRKDQLLEPWPPEPNSNPNIRATQQVQPTVPKRKSSSGR
jgi:NADH-quinone oxidoreductase subunit I